MPGGGGGGGGGRGVELTPLVVEMQLLYINYLMVGSRYGFYP